MTQVNGDQPKEETNPLHSALRAAEFWTRATGIYASYKGVQARGLLMKLRGKEDAYIKEVLWDEHHAWAGQQMYSLCLSLRGFYLKAGQFIGARADFIPEQICRTMSLLHDQVPPMPPPKVKAIIQQELGVDDLSQVFDWIDLEKPLGSASISQVHKAKLRTFSRQELRAVKGARDGEVAEHVVREGETVWDICNLHGITHDDLARHNRGLRMGRLRAGEVVEVPQLTSLEPVTGDESSRAVAAVLHATASGKVPPGGLVAVKVQYPDASITMSQDLVNIRAAADFLSRTELKFDLVSAVDELSKQIRLEFDFTREARVMDAVARHLRPLKSWLTIPESVSGLVTRRLLVMDFVDGVPLQELRSRVAKLSPRQAATAKRLILGRVSEAYGTMILGEGLFQADGHPGNILVMKGGRIGLLDYGQSKQLAPRQRRAFAQLIVTLNRNNAEEVSAALDDLGVITQKPDPEIRRKMAVGMFDTRGKVDPFDANSPIKQSAIQKFPQDLFFVLRVVQLLRGMAGGMGVEDFSSAKQWQKLAQRSLRTLEQEVEPLVIEP